MDQRLSADFYRYGTYVDRIEIRMRTEHRIEAHGRADTDALRTALQVDFLRVRTRGKHHRDECPLVHCRFHRRLPRLVPGATLRARGLRRDARCEPRHDTLQARLLFDGSETRCAVRMTDTTCAAHAP